MYFDKWLFGLIIAFLFVFAVMTYFFVPVLGVIGTLLSIVGGTFIAMSFIRILLHVLRITNRLPGKGKEHVPYGVGVWLTIAIVILGTFGYFSGIAATATALYMALWVAFYYGYILSRIFSFDMQSIDVESEEFKSMIKKAYED